MPPASNTRIPEYFQRAYDYLSNRAGAYRMVFDPAGARTFAVLSDLARFCRANESTAHTYPYAAARLDGRREVWLRINQHLRLSDDQLWTLYGGEK